MENKSFKETLFNKINSLSPEDKKLLERIYKINTIKGKLVIPKEMVEWVIENFGDVGNIEEQEIVKITNLITYEGSVFNDLRSRRPGINNERDGLFSYEKCGGEPFCKPLESTPEDVFGRIVGKFCITAANIAKIDAFHSVLIFKDHSPLDFTAEKIHDYFNVANQYFRKVNDLDKSFVYPFFFWNCLWKAGASLVHGHAQVTVTKDVSYSKVGLLRSRTLWYQENFKSNYFNDRFNIHKNLGLGFEIEGVRVTTDLCPIKERGISIHSANFNGSLSLVINSVLRVLVNEFGVRSFNLIAIPHPITPPYESWGHVPVIVEIVDRGKLDTKHSDFASMEIFAQSVVGSNPYHIIEKLKSELISNSSFSIAA